jgi:hypothetical protein
VDGACVGSGIGTRSAVTNNDAKAR